MDFTFKNCIKIKNFKRKIIAPFKLMLKKEMLLALEEQINKKLLGNSDFY